MEQSQANFTINSAANGLVVSPQGSLSDAEMNLMQQQVLERLHQSSYRFVIFSLAGVQLIDATEFIALKKLLSMCQLMGAKPILTDIHFGIASALVQLDVSFDGLTTYRTISEAINQLS